MRYHEYMLKGGQGDREMTQKYKDSEGAIYYVDAFGGVTDDTGHVYNTGFYDADAGRLFSDLVPVDGDKTPVFEGFDFDSGDYNTKIKGHYTDYGVFVVDSVKQEGTKEPQGKVASDGGPSDYYDFPEGCETLNDLIEYKQMSFAQGNIFKAAYRLGNKEGITLEYDLKKIKYYADRMLNQLEKGKGID